MDVRTTLRSAVERWSYLSRTLRLVWAATPRWTLLWLGLLVIQGILPAAIVYLTRTVVDALVGAAGRGLTWENLTPAVIPVALMAASMVLLEVLKSVADWTRTAQAEYVQDRISGLVHTQSARVDLAFYETPEYYDHLHRARSEAAGYSLAMLESVGALLQNSITLCAMAVVLLSYGVWLPLLLLASTLPALFVVLRYNRRYHRWWKDTTTKRRWIHYFDLLLTQGGFAHEIRLFSLGDHFRTAHQNLRQRLRGERLKHAQDQGLARVLAASAALFASGVAVAWMGRRIFNGLATLGDLALFYQAFSRGQELLRVLLSNIGQIYTNSLYTGHLFEFLELEPTIENPSSPQPVQPTLQDGVRFRAVVFRYPGSNRYALKGFDLFVPAGQIVAIVGANGAGKSTLVKLLCRFYDPESGSVELDGVNVRDFEVDDYRRRITALFQWPVSYQATARQNISFGDMSRKPSWDEVEAAARSAGAHEMLMRLPQGYDSLLGKWFAGGSELSAGEWQRIALARAFLRQADIIVLDEPTSFMDSWSENEWFERFRNVARDRTAIVITHRFTIAMRADCIHVMADGKIVESGSHTELLAAGGLYAQSWLAQMNAAPVAEPVHR